jgi:hypothetical protein
LHRVCRVCRVVSCCVVCAVRAVCIVRAMCAVCAVCAVHAVCAVRDMRAVCAVRVTCPAAPCRLHGSSPRLVRPPAPACQQQGRRPEVYDVRVYLLYGEPLARLAKAGTQGGRDYSVGTSVHTL